MSANLPPRILPSAVKSLAKASPAAAPVRAEPKDEAKTAPGLAAVRPAPEPDAIGKPQAAARERAIARHEGVDIEKKQDLPVLEAFQEFLDAERKRMRRRLTILAVPLVIVVVAVAATALIVGAKYTRELGQMRTDVAQFQEQARQMNADAKSALDNVNSDAAKLRQEVDSGKKSIAETAEEVRLRGETQQTDIEKLKEAVSAFRNENDSLRSELARIKGNWPAMSTSVEALQKEIERMRSQYFHEVAKSSEQEGQAARQALLSIPIIPRGRTEAVAWRLPIPE